MTIKLDPWGYVDISDYDKLLEQFGIQSTRIILDKLPLKHYYFTRRIVFGHRDMDKWLEAYSRGDRVAVLTGFMPSGHTHLGHLMVIEELKFLQKMNVFIKIAIADAEAYIVRRLERTDTINYGLEYITHALAWGLDLDKTFFYFQTNNNTDYYRLIQLFSRKVTLSELEAIYGEISPGKIIAAFTQVSDILHLQLDCYGGYKYVLVPVGADQDPHIRLARDIADRFEQELGFKRPASMYHKFITGLDGNKMSSSRPDYAIFLLDDLDIVKKKIFNALTGGRATAEEQRRLGGEPSKCSIYQLYMYFIDNDSEIIEVYNDCINGKVLCGVCKKRIVDKIIDILREHQKRYYEIRESDLLKKIVEIPSF
ncbi:MAG: tryptophan--tRNA ligase [Desulfurococcaceae archaeon]